MDVDVGLFRVACVALQRRLADRAQLLASTVLITLQEDANTDASTIINTLQVGCERMCTCVRACVALAGGGRHGLCQFPVVSLYVCAGSWRVALSLSHTHTLKTCPQPVYDTLTQPLNNLLAVHIVRDTSAAAPALVQDMARTVQQLKMARDVMDAFKHEVCVCVRARARACVCVHV